MTVPTGRNTAPAPGGAATAASERRRPTMAGRLTLVAMMVATVAVVVAGALSYGLVRTVAESQARTRLAQQADLIADAGARGTVRPGRRMVPALRAQGITLVRITADGDLVGGTGRTRAVVAPHLAALDQDRAVSATERGGGQTWFVEGRPLADGGAVALVQRRDDSQAFGRQVVNRTVLALAVGLVVAAFAGAWLARRLTRPLRRAATAAHQLATGARQVRVPVDGPAEVAEVAVSLNTLAAALEHSEGRQREFLLSVSHELRTPLTAIKGFAESLADGVVAAGDAAPVGATMLAEADRLDGLVSDLIDLARLGAQDFRVDLATVDMAGLLRSAAEVWKARCTAEGVAFRVELPPRPVPAYTDPTRVRQILDGLAENALRVTPAGRPIVFALRAEGPWAALEVRDGGPGLTEADSAVAFERGVLYQRYRGVRKVGTGVGLALVRGLTTRLGGRAAAGQAPEGGARFTVWLPVERSPETAVTRTFQQQPGRERHAGS